MLCKHCGKEIAEEAAFCKYCGKRTDGFKTCPVCKKDVDDDSAFCSFCGADLTSPTVGETAVAAQPYAVCATTGADAVTLGALAEAGAVKKTAVNLTRILNIAVVCISMLVALFALIFIFFAGFKAVLESNGETQSESADIFYYFGKAYKERAEILKLSQPSNYYKAATFLPCIFGTVISASSLISVCALVVTATVFNVQYIVGKRKKSGDAFAIAAFAVFVFCSAALLAMVNSTTEFSSDYLPQTIYYELNSTTVAGIVSGCVFTFIWLCGKIAVCGKQFFQTVNIVKCCLALAATVFTVVTVSLLTLPAIAVDSSEAGITDVKCGILQLLNSLGLLSFKGEGNEIATKAWVVFSLGTLAFLTEVGALICGGEFIIKAINNISGNGKKSLLGASIRTAVFTLITMVLMIVCGEMFLGIATEIGDSENIGKFSYGVPIAAFVLSIISIGIAVALKIYGYKKSQSGVLPDVQQTAEQTVTADTENSQS